LQQSTSDSRSYYGCDGSHHFLLCLEKNREYVRKRFDVFKDTLKYAQDLSCGIGVQVLQLLASDPGSYLFVSLLSLSLSFLICVI
jgi:hypothetical protein